MKIYPLREKEFESIVAEWLRHAKQREARKTSKSNPSGDS